MIQIDIPGYGQLTLAHIVLDYNGTMAVDGNLIPGVADALNALSADLAVHVLTADTFGKVRAQTAHIHCTRAVLAAGGQDRAKRDFVRELGCELTVAIGNGRNDRLMLNEAALGVAVILAEGAAAVTVAAADVVAKDILDALDLLQNPLRLVATLRS